MTNLICDFVLISAVVVFGYEVEVPCDRSPFHKFEEQCYNKNPNRSEQNSCIYKASGFINDAGEIFPEVLRNMLKDYTVRPDKLDVYIGYVTECANSVGHLGNLNDATKAFDNCDLHPDAGDIFREAVCLYDEDDDLDEVDLEGK